jgi:hypothetical protein
MAGCMGRILGVEEVYNSRTRLNAAFELSMVWAHWVRLDPLGGICTEMDCSVSAALRLPLS